VRSLKERIKEHPARVALASSAVLVLSFVVLGVALIQTWETTHNSQTSICIAVNELSRKIYVTLADYGFPPSATRKFIPTLNCGTLP